MSKHWQGVVLVAPLALLLVTGCASRRGTKEQLNMLSSQVLALTNEVANLSDNQRALERIVRTTESRQQQVDRPSRRTIGAPSSSAKKSGAGKSGSATVENGIYRTPSGFELQVEAIQGALRNAGYYNGNVDGLIGKVTEDAITRFQQDNGLDADGVVGRKTWAKLKEFA